MKRAILLFILLPIIIPGYSQQKEVMEVLNTQTRCWNVGDLDCFMQTYWKSDSLIYIGKDGVTYGWAETYKKYDQEYPDGATGVLSFNILKLQPLGNENFFVAGKFFLRRQEGDTNGHFTLLMRKIDGKWVITADHSS
jgi:hypothetical protein